MTLKRRFRRGFSFGQVTGTYFYQEEDESVGQSGGWTTVKTITIPATDMKTVDTEWRSVTVSLNISTNGGGSHGEARIQFNGQISNTIYCDTESTTKATFYFPIDNLNSDLVIVIQGLSTTGNVSIDNLDIEFRAVTLER